MALGEVVGDEEQRSLAAGESVLPEAWFALLQEALATQGSLQLPLRGTSMRPTFPSRCTVRVEPAGRLQVGTVVVYQGGEALLTHRLVRRLSGGWLAQGDGQRRPDPPLAEGQLLGVVVEVLSEDGRRYWPQPWSRLTTCLWIGRHYFWAVWRALRPAWWGRYRSNQRRPGQPPGR